MTTVAISSIRQYTIDRFRISLGVKYEIDRIRELDFYVFDKDNNDVTSNLKSIKDSNAWTDSELREQGKFAGKTEIDTFEICLNTNSYLEPGTYIFAFYEKVPSASEPAMIFNYPLDIEYMEDIRTTIGSAVPISIDKLKIIFTPLNEKNPSYQSKTMMKLMNISIYDVGESSGTNYNDVFEPLSSIIDSYGDSITELTLTLKKGRVLPEGYYNIILTTRYQSRTFSVIENEFRIPFLTTAPPHIGSANITKNAEGLTNLDIVFDSFLEQTMFDTSEFFVTDANGVDITDKFEGKQISPTYNSTSGITYITKISIPLFEGYTLEKGALNISFTWDKTDKYKIYDPLNYTINSKKWFVESMNSIILIDLDHLKLILPKYVFVEDYPNMGYIIEKYNSSADEYVADETLQVAFGPIYIPEEQADNQKVGAFQIDIIDKTKLKQDNIYSFITYHVEEDGERIYDFIGHIDIIGEITPIIASVEQNGIDMLKVTLENELPLDVISYCKPKLLKYGETEYVDDLIIEFTEDVIETGKTKTKEFVVRNGSDVVLERAQYTFNLLFGNKLLDKPVTVFLHYMESKKGFIKSIEQISLSEILVKFSEPQSRSFLLETQLRVVKKDNDETEGVDYTDRFELIENVMKADAYTFTELTIPMDHEDSIPAGKYTISLMYLINDDADTDIVTVYSYDAELGFMTNNTPNISAISRKMDENGLTTIKISFDPCIEEGLFNCAKITLKDPNGRDVLWKFQDPSDWTVYTSGGLDGGYIKSLELKVRNKDIKIEKGEYLINFSWKGVIKYLEDIPKLNEITKKPMTVSLDYVLPMTEEQEVVSYNSAENKARLYFKFDNFYQNQYFVDMEVLPFNASGQNHSEYFSTISEANPFKDATITSTDNINLDVLDPLSITQGIYKFIFYHEKSILLSLSTTLPQSVSSSDLVYYRYEVIDENGNDVSLRFKSIMDGIDPEQEEISSLEILVKDSENIYISDSSTFELRLYNTTGARVAVTTTPNIIDINESDYMSKLDIKSTLSPRFASVEAYGHNRMLVTLRSAAPQMILEEYNFTLYGFSHTDYTSYIDTITDSNNDSDAWDSTTEENRWVSSFYLRVRGGCILDESGYSLTLYAGTLEEIAAGVALELDEISFSLPYMEGIDCEIKSIKPFNLSTLRIEFHEAQNLALLKTMIFTMTNTSGINVASKFKPFEEIVNDINYNETSVIDMPLLEETSLNSDYYTFKFIRPSKIEDIDFTTAQYPLTYMSSVKPLIVDVQATKINSDADGLVIDFLPPLAKELYENAIISIQNTSGKSIKDNFVNPSDAILQIEDDNDDGIEYVYKASFELNPGETIDRDFYETKFEWVDDEETNNDYGYVEELYYKGEINCILLPLESIEIKDPSTLELRFTSDMEASYLQNCELHVDSSYRSKNTDGPVATDVNFTEKFKLLSETNDFTSSTKFRKIIVKLKDDEQLPVATYRFVIGEKDDEDERQLKYKYAGKIDIKLMTGVDVITKNKCEITQTGLDTLKLSFDNPVNVEIFNKAILTLTGVSSKIKDENFNGYFMSVKESNKYVPVKTEEINISNLIKDKNLQKQYDLAYSGLLDFDNLYVFHIEALIAAGIIDDAQIESIIKDKNNLMYSKRDVCVEAEAEYMLNDFVVTVTKDDAYLTEQPIDAYTDSEANIYSEIEDKTYYYDHAEKTDTVINGIHYISYTTDIVYLKLNEGKAIPEGVYNLVLKFEKMEMVKQEISTTFMTTTPPQITSMRVTDNHMLQVDFYPYVEENTMLGSNFKLMIYSGLDDKGQPIGLDVTNNFSSILNATFDKVEQKVITYISTVSIPIEPTASLPSGKYKLDWTWDEQSFLEDLSFVGSLDVIAKGIKSATLYDQSTIKIVLDNKVLVSNLKTLEVSVENSMNEDCGELFDDAVSFDKDLTDESLTDTFYIKVEDEEDVVTDIYRFMLIFDMPENDTDDEIIPTPAYEFAMNIVFMTTEFPSIENIDNLSTKAFIVNTITRDNRDDYYGLYIQPLKSTTKTLLTKENSTQFLDTVVKIFDAPAIDSLYMVFTEEVYPCLLNACTATVINSEGLSVSDKFKTVAESNTFIKRQIVDCIEITLQKAYEDEELEKFEVTVFQADGEEITDKFESIKDSNSFEDGIKIRSFKILADDEEETIEEYETEGIEVIVKDNTGQQVTNFKSKVVLKTTDTITMAKLSLDTGYTLPPDQYTVTLSYQNEPGFEGAVTVNPFTYSGKLPFLSTNLGNIIETKTSELSKLFITYSEDLPISLFMDMKMGIYNEDNEDCIDSFKDLQETNDFDGVNMLSQLSTPMTLELDLKAGKSLPASKYTLRFTTNISPGADDDGEEEMGDDERVTNDEITDEYVLWSHGTALPFMIKTSDNTITDIKQTAIDELKVTLEDPIDLNLLKTFSVAVENKDNGKFYGVDTFKDLDESNRFGYSVLLSDKKYILYSEDGASWSRFDTGLSVSFNAMVYDDASENLIVSCSNGKILTISSFTSSGLASHDTGISSGLNSIIKVKNKFIGVGLNGTIIVGLYSDGKFAWKPKTSNTKNTLTQIIAVSETELFAVGYKATLLHSTDSGETWEVIPMTSTSNFNGIINYKYVLEPEESETEDDASTDDDLLDEEDINDEIEEDDTDSDVDDNSKHRNGIYIVGSDGAILYSPDGKGKWETLTSGTKKSLFSITSYKNRLIVVGDTGTVLVSPDTKTFNSVNSGVTFTLRSIVLCDEKLIACGMNGKWITSLSGNNWTVNSTTYANTFRCVGYVPSQYEDNRNINYFYLKLDRGAELGRVSFHTGTEVPTLENMPAKLWKGDSARENHVGDIYNMFDTSNGLNVLKTTYQFVLDKTYDTETGILVASEYKWKEVVGPTALSTGDYTFYIVEKEPSDLNELDDTNSIDGRKIYFEKSGIDLNYMTTEPGELKSVTLTSPDIKEDVAYQVPFIHLEIKNCNEIATYFSSYEIINQNGEDCSGYFLPIKQGVYDYSDSYRLNGINLLGNPETIWNIPAGEYVFRWSWTRYDENKTDLQLSIPKIYKFIKTVSPAVPVINAFQFEIDSTYPPLEYFTEVDEDGAFNLQTSVYKITNGDKNNSTQDYISNFMAIFESTDFSDSQYITEDKKISKFNMQLISGKKLTKGSYIVKFTNGVTPITDDESMVVTTTVFNVPFELTDVLPSISNVSLDMYSNVVEGIVNDNANNSAPLIENYSGTVHPALAPYYSNWKMMGTDSEWDSELKKHVGDIYTNIDIDKSYSFMYDSYTGDYRWEMNVAIPHLIITFKNKPTFDVVTKYTQSITFNECDESGNVLLDLSHYLLMDNNTWDYSTTTADDEVYVSQIKIPLDETKSYPGSKNATLCYYWKDGCIYDDLKREKIVTQSAIRDYGQISYVSPIMIPGLTANDRDEYGLIIKFEKMQFTKFLKDIDWTLTHQAYDSEGALIDEDVSGCFKDILVSNPEFSDNSITKADTMYLFLQDSQSIDSGTYTLEMIGYKTADDILSQVDDGTVRFSVVVNLPWMTGTPPETFFATFSTDKEGFNYPVLNIKFDVAPPIDAVNQFSISVTKASELMDYTDCFRKYSSSLIRFNQIVEDGVVTRYVESIDIPMKRCRGMKTGTYDVSFKFNPDSILAPLPSDGTVVTFKLDKNVITKMGKITNMTTKGRAKMIVEFQPDAEVEGTNIASSQVGRVYGWSSWNDAINKDLTMSAKNGKGKEKINMFKGPEISGNKLTFTLKDNCKVNPCKLKLGLKYNNKYVISAKKIAFKGLIVNLKASKKDKLCWILVIKHDGTTKRHVYSTYEKAQKRIKKLKKLNKAEKEQIALCKQCRKIKLLSTSKIKAQLEKYTFPVGRPLKFFKKAAKKYYKYQSKQIGCTEVNIDADIIDDEDVGTLACENYVKKATPYSWTLKIATMATKYPKSGKVINFAYHVKNGVQLERGFKANKKGKKTKKFKKYLKKLKKFIKNYKKKAAKCKKCKKRRIAAKGSTSIGWNAAMFPQYLRTKSSVAKALIKIINKFFKKKKNGCAKAKFKFVKKNKNYCKLTCKKYKKNDKTLEYGSFRAYFKK